MNHFLSLKKKVKNVLKKAVARKNHAVAWADDKVAGIRLRQAAPCLILFCDGGIASQMYQYMWGQMLIDEGYPVKYDYTFYKVDGKDMNGIFDRSYVLDKMCVLDRVDIAPGYQARYYRRHYLNPLNQQPQHGVTMNLHQKWKMPLYLGNYYTCNGNEYLAAFKKYIRLRPAEEILDEKNFQMYRKITSVSSVGVHVRRGDMVQSMTSWRTPAIDYFVNAIKRPEFKDMEFFFFSDELDWVKNNILPRLKNISYTLVDANGSEKGYMDLFLLSQCNHQIASQGSFGVVAFVMNSNPGKMLILPEGARSGNRERLAGENVVYYTLEGDEYS